jgi:hypothetical protein
MGPSLWLGGPWGRVILDAGVVAWGMKNRQMLRKHLAVAEQSLVTDEIQITKQLQLVAKLQAGGHDVRKPKAVLAEFEQLQREHLAHRDHLLKKLASSLPAPW